MPLDQVDVDNIQPEEKEMTFFEHLEALRWHIIRAFVGIAIVAVFIFFQKDFIFKTVIFGPRNPDFFTYRLFCSFGEMMCIQPTHFEVITRDLAEKFTSHLTVSLILGLIVAFPYVFWEFWRFVKPGLYSNEKKSARGIVLICSVLFVAGVLFGYYFIAPFALSFLAGYELADTLATPTLNSYINYMIMFTLPVGIVFEMPVVSFFLTRVGILTPRMMRTGRRYAVIIILIVAAILTPSPDVISQMILATPLYVLYEMSIAVSARVSKKLEKERKIEEADLEAREKAILERQKMIE
ncbi:MAG: twin-arginine translocase subunit TatC [Saprospiraceae bacterium]|jgi:sec-independent protein translocase protein TatC|nr:twin-arginine translocase subunit TatC [Saprospiraceae bacterium]MCA0333965.1 twin-arginine translocase subunit TatC [Bacteroidota bacterium]MCB0605922.1 twin-arginine translocase subunit TatC [Saprospiraceae bacterium]MCO5278221.1 twin-arginine translocase subunit TatC [Saprospiraceae bacterium]HQU95869.1 twin-arginine translocase subunit TatC [Saprospiraceae bacterium]